MMVVMVMMVIINTINYHYHDVKFLAQNRPDVSFPCEKRICSVFTGSVCKCP